MVEVREILRLWLRGMGLRRITRVTGVDRKTVRRYVEAGQAAGLEREDGEERLDDGFVGEVMGRVQGRGPGRHGASWRSCQEHEELLRKWVGEGLRLTKVRVLLGRHSGDNVPYRTLHRFARSELGFGKPVETVRVDDPEPGQEVQVDFGRMGWIVDGRTGRRRVVWALILTAVWSRHTFIWLCHRQTVEDVVAGFEAAWQFFGGVFPVVIIDNLKAVVTKADPLKPVINETFLEYSQGRGFVIDAARSRHADDKPRVERSVPYVRESFFAGESFADLSHAQREGERWCREHAGRRVHGTTRRAPLECFNERERALLLPVPADRYDLPTWTTAKVHRDRHVTFGCALYSAGGVGMGEKVRVRGDSTKVKIYHRGELIRVHSKQERGGRSTHRDDIPTGREIYARRDSKALVKQAQSAGKQIGEYAARLIDTPLPWTRMRHVYRLLGLVRRYGSEPVEEACSRALELDVIDVTRVSRIVEQATEKSPPPAAPAASVIGELRYLRPAAEYERPRHGGHDV